MGYRSPAWKLLRALQSLLSDLVLWGAGWHTCAASRSLQCTQFSSVFVDWVGGLAGESTYGSGLGFLLQQGGRRRAPSVLVSFGHGRQQGKQVSSLARFSSLIGFRYTGINLEVAVQGPLRDCSEREFILGTCSVSPPFRPHYTS
jgi:hypothetical protein